MVGRVDRLNVVYVQCGVLAKTINNRFFFCLEIRQVSFLVLKYFVLFIAKWDANFVCMHIC